jgi:hypothetical protein
VREIKKIMKLENKIKIEMKKMRKIKGKSLKTTIFLPNSK